MLLIGLNLLMAMKDLGLKMLTVLVMIAGNEMEFADVVSVCKSDDTEVHGNVEDE